MTAFRFFLIIVVFCVAAVGWLILGATIEYRTHSLTQRLSEEVDTMWGPSGLAQQAPTPEPLKSDIQVQFDHEHRYKGLLWFSTYTAEFTGTYEVAAANGPRATGTFQFALPAGATFDHLAVTLDGDDVDPGTIKQGNELRLPLPTNDQTHTISVTYRTFGRDYWLYDLSRGGETTSMINTFTLTATTDFRDIGYAEDHGGRSPAPHPAEAVDGGMRATWQYEHRTTGEKVGIEMPQRPNAGAIAGRMAFFAPIGLLFFFTVLFTIVILKGVTLHPMHYLFISAGFFAFHILLAYLVDRIALDLAFWICAAVSAFLVVSYMRLVAGVRFAVVYVGLAQLVYLVGFSYAFTWEGNTGLTITITAIATLLVLMQATGRLDWNEVFRRSPARPPAVGAAVSPVAAPPAEEETPV